MVPPLKQGKDGNWRAKIGDKWVALKTPDYFVAREKAERLQSGDSSTPIADAAASFAGGGDDWTADAVRAAAQSASGSAEYFPPGQAPPVNDKPTDETEDKPSVDGTTVIPPQLMEGLIKQVAATLVELQIHGQEYLWLRFAKLNPGQVAPESDARKVPAAIWESQVRKWIPTDMPLPEWVVAPLLVAFMAGTVQLEGARPVEPGPGGVPSES